MNSLLEIPEPEEPARPLTVGSIAFGVFLGNLMTGLLCLIVYVVWLLGASR